MNALRWAVLVIAVLVALMVRRFFRSLIMRIIFEHAYLIPDVSVATI